MSRILLVDDDPNYTFALSALLTGGGHQVEVAHEGAKALTTARDSCCDGAFLDLRLPDADGLTLLDQIAEVDPMLPVICLTGREDTSAVVQAMRKGAVDCLTKPVDRQTLFNAVDSASVYSSSRRAGAAATPGLAMMETTQFDVRTEPSPTPRPPEPMNDSQPIRVHSERWT